MKSLAFKIAFNNKIGSGHLFRCSNLSANLKKKKIKTYLILKNKTQFQNLNYLNKSFNEIKIIKNFNEEKKFLEKNLIKNFLIDDPKVNFNKQKKYSKVVNNLILYQDIPKKNFCNLIINHNYILNAKKKYESISRKNTKFLLGLRFYLIDSKKNIKPKNEITIFLGGYPPIKILKKIIKAILSLKINDIKVNIFSGYLKLRKSEFIGKEFKKVINFYHLSKRNFFFNKINNSKIFITSGGSSLIEGIFLKKLCVVLNRAKNQENNCINFNKKKLIYLLNSKFYSNQIKKIILDNQNKKLKEILLYKRLQKFVKLKKKNILVKSLCNYLK